MPPNGQWGAYRSSICHYCEGKAETDDHIVPRSALPRPQSRLPYWFRSVNIVPACRVCNNWKGDYRSTCECSICTWAWDTALAVFLPVGFVPRGIRLLPPPPREARRIARSMGLL